MKSLIELLPDHAEILPDMSVKGLTLTSTDILPGFLFIALKGTHTDGHRFIPDAIAKGAAVIFYEADAEDLPLNATTIPLIPIAHLREKVGEIAARFYDDPSKDLTVIGVTGTSGKTTCVHLLREALTQLGIPCASIGTLGVQFKGAQKDFGLTTPDAVNLQHLFYELKASGAKAIAMEVSSHALEQSRVAGVHFTGAVFTNLSQDHLDYHETMPAYLAAKAKLFSYSSLKFSVLNRIEAASFEILKTTTSVGETYWYGDEHMPAVIQTKLVGAFNKLNALAVSSVLKALGFSPKEIAEVSVDLPVAGRMEAFGGGSVPCVIVDYSHKPGALEKVLQALRPQAGVHTLWCVFGCGGDRDRAKRPLMGKIASQLADKVILTNDNPRTEAPDVIVAEILAGVSTSHKHKIKIELDRREAIAYAISHAKQGDVILVAGKGHEDYQIIGTQKHSFNDAHCVQGLLEEVKNVDFSAR